MLLTRRAVGGFLGVAMGLELFDAHNHFQDERLDEWREAMAASLPGAGVTEMVVNGSCEDDWGRVAELAERFEWVLPAFGLHPWYVRERSAAWREVLDGWLRRFPEAVVGEMGLDRWIADPDMEAQRECFLWQLSWAAREERAVTIHCLRAFGLLDELLRQNCVPDRGFLLHSYGGPAEMIPGFARLGAYFSVSPYFAHERKRSQLEAFKLVPLERLLVETDAPDMWPPVARNPNPLRMRDGSELNHPANVRFCYEMLAEVRGLALDELAAVVGENYRRLFGARTVRRSGV
jgi:TatD DNase family protein